MLSDLKNPSSLKCEACLPIADQKVELNNEKTQCVIKLTKDKKATCEEG